MRLDLVSILILLFFTSSVFASNLEKLFYITPDVSGSAFSTEQLQQIKMNAKSTDIIAPQIYQLDEKGKISGNIDSELLYITQQNHLKIMPLIVNCNFDQVKLHTFLNNKSAEEKAISEMLLLCKQYH